MESRFDDARARGWREQYRAFPVGSSLLYDDPHSLIIGDESWEPVPGPLGVPQPVQTQFHNGTFYQLMRRWVRRAGAQELDQQIDTSAAGALELAGQAIRHAAEDNRLPAPDPDTPIWQQIREVLEAFSAQVATFTEARRVLLALADACDRAEREGGSDATVIDAFDAALCLGPCGWDDTANAIRRLCGVDDG